MLQKFYEKYPKIGERVFIAENTSIIGDVRLADDSSIFYGSVLRGDINYISIGEASNIQDISCCHVADEYPCIVGDNCVVGHRVMLHGAKIDNNCLVGMGATILNGAEIGKGSIIAAGALIPERKKIPPFSMVMGVPGKVIRSVTEKEYKNIIHYARKYVFVKNSYLSQKKELSDDQT